MKKLAAALGLVLTSSLASFLAAGLGAPANAADDDYTSKVRTSCHVTVPAVVRVDQAPRIRVHVQPNGPAPAASAGAAQRAETPRGSVTVRIIHAGSTIFTRTVAYHGSPVTIVGPVVTDPGHYTVRAQFRAADGSVFRGCSAATAFDVRAGNDGDGDGDGDGDPQPPGGNGGNEIPQGLLPDTGGPDVLWLLIALVLVGSGGGLVYAAKRRPRGPLYDV